MLVPPVCHWVVAVLPLQNLLNCFFPSLAGTIVVQAHIFLLFSFNFPDWCFLCPLNVIKILLWEIYMKHSSLLYKFCLGSCLWVSTPQRICPISHWLYDPGYFCCLMSAYITLHGIPPSPLIGGCHLPILTPRPCSPAYLCACYHPSLLFFPLCVCSI